MKLSTVLKSIGEESARLDDQAAKILDLCRSNQITSEAKFREAVTEAYNELGWRTIPGRPAADDGLQPAPKTVRQYVFEIRRAYKLRIKVVEMNSLFELRAAVKEKRERLAQQEAPEPVGALSGLKLVQANRFTGAHIHDLAVLYESVPKRMRAEIEQQVQRLINKYLPKVPEQLRLVA